MIKMKKHEYEIGKIYGVRKLLSISKDSGRAIAETECIYCGKKMFVRPDTLFNNKFNSCRCQVTKHNAYKTRLYGVWGNMKYRCSNPNAQGYHNYGGKGIKVCDEWKEFEPFQKWAIENGYRKGLSIDRVDSNGDYCPENCRWVTLSENVAESNRSTQHRMANKGMYYAYTPSGDYVEFENAAEFSRQNGFDVRKVRSHANRTRGVSPYYKGWKFGFVEELESEPQSTIEST